jgi:hypothetical protein
MKSERVPWRAISGARPRPPSCSRDAVLFSAGSKLSGTLPVLQFSGSIVQPISEKPSGGTWLATRITALPIPKRNS